MPNPTETTIETRIVGDHTVDIVRLDWPDGGVLYDVYVHEDADTLDLLTVDESLTAIPGDEEIGDLLEAHIIDGLTAVEQQEALDDPARD